jgi:hypothetical protein
MAGGNPERGQRQQVLQPIDRRLLPAGPFVKVVRGFAQRRQQPLDVLMRPWLRRHSSGVSAVGKSLC